MGALVLLLCLAVCIFTPPGDGAQELTTPGSRIEAACDGCPRHKSSATLVPSFTKTTPTTTHRTTRPTNHTTTHPTTPTTTHRTTRPTNHTTTHPTNHTTPHRTTRPTNHTTTHPTNHTTTHPTNHTTTRGTHHTTTHPANHTTPHTTPHLTTAAPTLPPDAAVGNYLVWNGSDVCLRVQSGLQIRIQYENRTKAWLWGAFTVQPNHTVVVGTCSQDSATMNITFAQGFLHFTFVKRASSRRRTAACGSSKPGWGSPTSAGTAAWRWPPPSTSTPCTSGSRPSPFPGATSGTPSSARRIGTAWWSPSSSGWFFWS
ncbi:macrosialin isoform X2 [Lepidochelys kempii]|uniref:macrosialin isoform X2 n=1 Tax=Lepidochelys kempii TaxID=8472 RepID=UPI003C6F73D0